MLKKLLVAAAMSTIALSAFAVDASQVEKSIQLKDGTTVYVFADGKMGMISRFGHATYMEPGHAMETKDGKRIVMNGNEVARIEQIFHKNNTP